MIPVQEALEYQRSMVTDWRRTDALREAIHQTISPGDVVVDVGTGTGILALFALEAGAARVYAIESGPIAAVAAQMFAANDAGSRIRLIRKEARLVSLPELADVVISETLGNFGIDENVIELLQDARRFLKPGGRVVPRGLTVLVAPAMDVSMDARILWAEPQARYSLDFGPLAGLDLQREHRGVVQPEALLGAGQVAWSFEFSSQNVDAKPVQLHCPITRGGTVTGLCGWFKSELAPGVELETGPDAPRTHWRQVYFPLASPVPVEAGQTLAVRLRPLALMNRVFVEWQVGDGESGSRGECQSPLATVTPIEGLDVDTKCTLLSWVARLSRGQARLRRWLRPDRAVRALVARRHRIGRGLSRSVDR